MQGYAGDKADRKSHCGYVTYVGGNLVTWRSQKQYVVSRSSAKSEYRAMANTTSKMLWLRSLLVAYDPHHHQDTIPWR